MGNELIATANVSDDSYTMLPNEQALDWYMREEGELDEGAKKASPVWSANMCLIASASVSKATLLRAGLTEPEICQVVSLAKLGNWKRRTWGKGELCMPPVSYADWNGWSALVSKASDGGKMENTTPQPTVDYLLKKSGDLDERQKEWASASVAFVEFLIFSEYLVCCREIP